MKNIASLIIIFSITISCNQKENPNQEKTNGSAEKKIEKNSVVKDTTPRVTGIGGIFFRSKNVDSLKKWYNVNLGIVVTEYGSTFESRNANRPDEINYLQWSPFNEKTKYFDPSAKEFMINYRVQNIEGMVRNLKRDGVIVVDSIETYDYGKFVHILDLEGNKIELWEPKDSVLTTYGGETTK